MTGGPAGSGQAPPTPSWYGAANARNLVGLALRATYKVRVTGVHRVPREGSLVVVANHTGPLDGAAVLGTSPRPVHVVDDVSSWPPVVSRATRAAGVIPLAADTLGRDALLEALAALADERAVACFPEGVPGRGDAVRVRPGVGYLVARSAAPVLPVAVLGGRGRNRHDPPRPRSEVDVVFGDPVWIPVTGDPRRRAVASQVAERVRQVLADHVAAAVARTGHALPGAGPARLPGRALALRPMPEDGAVPVAGRQAGWREVGA